MSERKRMIAVVDDDPRVLESLENLFESAGHAVRTFSSAKVLIDAGLSDTDCLITDIGMPGMDGFELMRELRRRGSGNGGNVPAIALTAYAGEESRREALAAGFEEHVAKPAEPQQLVAAVARLAGRRPPSSA